MGKERRRRYLEEGICVDKVVDLNVRSIFIHLGSKKINQFTSIKQSAP